MPGKYAHYRFGAELLKTLPPEIRRTVNRHRALYDVGLHGPDIFFYHNPARQTAAGALGKKFHHQTGKEFFTRACKRHRLEPNEAARAYLYGLLAHYCLDMLAHPVINHLTREGNPGHIELETEFDRYLLEKDGKLPPYAQDCSRHMVLNDAEAAEAAAFYPGATAGDVARAVKNMANVSRLLALPAGLPRKALDMGIHTVARKYRQFYMTEGPNPSCAHLDAELEAAYTEALARYPVLLKQIVAYLTCSVPLGSEFDPEFD